MINFKDIITKSANILLLAFVFCIPFNWHTANISLWIFMGLCLLNRQTYNKESYKNIGKAAILFAGASVAYILWMLASMLWTNDTAYGNKLILRMLPLLGIPISIVIGKACGYIRDTRWLLVTFVAGTIAVDICNLYLSYKDCWYDVDGQAVFFNNPYKENISFVDSINQGYSHFSYMWLSHFGHPSYISLYGLFSIAVLYHSIRNRRHSITAKILLYMAITFSLIMVYLLNSRANLIAIMFLFLCILAYEIAVKKNYVLPIIILAAGISGGAFVFSTGRGETLKSKVSNIQEQTKQTQNYKGIDVRLDIWIEATQVIKKYPIWGTGIGDGDNALMGQYLIDGSRELYEREYVTHNQFLDVQMTRGIMGTITLLALFIIPFAAAIRRRDFVLMTLVVIMVINCIFENMLNRSGGFMFYPLMTALLLVADRKTIN